MIGWLHLGALLPELHSAGDWPIGPAALVSSQHFTTILLWACMGGLLILCTTHSVPCCWSRFPTQTYAHCSSQSDSARRPGGFNDGGCTHQTAALTIHRVNKRYKRRPSAESSSRSTAVSDGTLRWRRRLLTVPGPRFAGWTAGNEQRAASSEQRRANARLVFRAWDRGFDLPSPRRRSNVPRCRNT